MGLLTLAQLRDELKVALGGRDGGVSSALSTNDSFNRWLNMGYSLVCQPEVRRHYETRTRVSVALVANTDEYLIDKTTVGFNILGFELVEYFEAAVILASTRRWKLDPRPIEWFSNFQPRSAGMGPRYYSRDGNLLRISPYPQSSVAGNLLRLSVYREPSPLVAETDKTVLLDYFDNAVVMAGEYFAKLRLGYRELAINTRQELQSYCNQKLDAGETDTDPGGRAELISESPMGWSS